MQVIDRIKNSGYLLVKEIHFRIELEIWINSSCFVIGPKSEIFKAPKNWIVS